MYILIISIQIIFFVMITRTSRLVLETITTKFDGDETIARDALRHGTFIFIVVVFVDVDRGRFQLTAGQYIVDHGPGQISRSD